MDAFVCLDRNHPLFTSHGHWARRYDTILSFPPGTGGNFITGLGGARCDRIDAVNAYSSLGVRHLILDDTPWTEERDLDMLHDLAGKPVMHTDDLDVHVARCHNLPWMSSMVFGTSAEELVVLGISYKDSWLPSVLNMIKWRCNKDWNGNPHMVMHLLQNARHDGPVDLASYIGMCEMVVERFGLDVERTVIGWLHYMRCREQGLSLFDPMEFSNTISTRLFTTLYEVFNGLPNGYLSLWRGQVFDMQLAELMDRMGRIKMVDYVELMCDMSHRDDGYLRALDVAALHRYSATNISLVRMWLSACWPGMREHGRSELDRLESRLQVWRPLEDSNL